MHPIQQLVPGLLLISALPAQVADASDWRGMSLRRAEVLDSEQRGFRASLSAGKVVELSLGAGRRVPLLRPVSDWQIAELPGQVYVILAGGIRESLDLYLYESKTGSIEVIGTDGGRLLPAEFGEGQGSWPRFEGRALVFFPYERDDRLHFTVVNFQGQLLARQVLPLDVAAYRVEIDAASYQVKVAFDSRSEPLTFLHPAAPRLVLDAGLLLFSSPERRSFLLRNAGQRPLHVDLELEGQGYRIVGPKSAVIPASSSREITVEMSAFADGRARLAISSPVPGAEAVVSLQNLNALEVASDVLPAGAEPESQALVEASARVAKAREEPSAALPGELAEETSESLATAAPVLDAAQAAGFQIRRIDGYRVEVSGRFSLVDGWLDLPDMLVRNRRSGEVQTGSLAIDGSFRVTIAAAGGDELECACASHLGEAAYLALGPILPTLSSDRGALIATGRAGTNLLLLEVITRGPAELPSRVLRSWRVHADGRGRARIPISSLGVTEGARSFLLLMQSSGQQVSQTQVVRISGEFSQRR